MFAWIFIIAMLPTGESPDESGPLMNKSFREIWSILCISYG